MPGVENWIKLERLIRDNREADAKCPILGSVPG
jgi:hypothetical protein